MTRNIGDIYTWKDRPGRIRVMVMTKKGVLEARRYFYSKKYKDYDLDGYRILQLDMNPYNFNKTNLVKVSVLEMNLLLNNNLLSKTDDYKFNKKMNKLALKVVKSLVATNHLNKVLKDE